MVTGAVRWKTEMPSAGAVVRSDWSVGWWVQAARRRAKLRVAGWPRIGL
jgi:hypothetical protein